MLHWSRPSGRARRLFAACTVGLSSLVTASSALAQEAAPNGVVERDQPVWQATDLNLPNLTGGQVIWIDIPANDRAPFVMTLPTERHKDLRLSLVPNSVQDPDNFQVREVFGPGPNDWRLADLGKEATYQGSVVNVNDSDVRLSITAEGLIGGVFLPNGDKVYIQPLSDFIPGSPVGLHVVYSGDQTSCDGICGTPDDVHVDLPDFQTRGTCGAGSYCTAQVAMDADFPYYQARGSSTTATRDRMAAILNVVNHQYQRDVQITHVITTIFVRTSVGSDPYTSTNSSTLLSQFRTEWNGIAYLGIVRDVAHLFTGREIDSNVIGIAYVSQVCDVNDAYGLSQSDFSATFACSTDLTAHELGHNWGANHCTCTTSTMNPSITCVNTFQNSTTPNSITDIDAYQGGVACLTTSPVVPANNMCSAATRIDNNGTFLGSTVNATTDGGRTGCGSQGSGTDDIWWVITPPITGTLEIDTCGSSFDTILGVYDDCPGGIDDTVICNNDNTTVVSFTAVGGRTYYIRVSGDNGASGSVTLNVNATQPTSNSLCSAATVMTEGITYTDSLYGASFDGEANCGATTDNDDVWYQFTAPCNGTFTVDTCGSHDWNGVDNSGMDTVVSIHSACVGNIANQLGCDDDVLDSVCVGDVSPFRDSQVSVVMTRGQNVKIRVTHFSTAYGNGMFRIRGTFTDAPEAPLINAIASETVACGPYTGPTPSLVAPACMPGTTYSLVNGPVGMTINSATGVVSWPSPTISTPVVTIRATNAQGSDDEGWIVTVTRIAPVVTAIASTTGTCNVAYTGPIPTVTNPTCMNPITAWSLVAAPVGMTIGINGQVSWPNPVIGVHVVTIRATNSEGTDDETWNLTIGASAPVVNDIVNASLSCGSAYTGPTPTVTNVSCMTGITYSLVTSPAGMTINAATGVVSWPTPVVGANNITIRATNAGGFDDESWTLTVNRIAPVLNDIVNATIACAGSYTGPTPTLTNTACMNPVTYSLITGPAGMTVNPATGVVSWPTVVGGTHTITIRGTNSAGFDDEAWLLTVTRIVPVINNVPDATISTGAPYVGPIPTLTNPNCMNGLNWTLTAGPVGMVINSSTGQVGWPAPTLGPVLVTIRATNSAGQDEESWLLNVTNNPCDSVDFNNDTLTPDSGDLDDFIAVLAGGPSACSTFPVPGCNDLDFNNDGLFPDSLDLDAFISRLAGGPCLQ
jgi:hypothetical protein